MKKVFTKFSPFNLLIWTACLAIIGGMIAGAMVLFGPVDVLRDWKMSVGGEGKTFAVSQTVYFESSSVKLTSAEGHADRYLICDAKDKYIEREVAINPVALNRPAGENPLRKNSFEMPKLVAFDDEEGVSTLPRVCRLHINACYPLYNGLRNHCEQAETEKFTVVAELQEGQSGDNSADVSDIPAAPTNQSNASRNRQPSTVAPTENTSNNTGSTTNNNVTNNEAEQPACTLDTNVLGLIPIKLGCR